MAFRQDWGACTDAGPSGLNVLEYLSGGGQEYCLCDVGLCDLPPPDPAMVLAGQTDAIFSWDGINWTGPSDFGNPEGPPFPAGVYILELSAIGTVGGVDFEVRNEFELTLVP